jgi:hypothetical protein
MTIVAASLPWASRHFPLLEDGSSPQLYLGHKAVISPTRYRLPSPSRSSRNLTWLKSDTP